MNGKKIIQDVIPPAERSIRRIPLSDRQMRSREKEEPSEIFSNRPPRRKKRKTLYWGLAGVVLVVLIIVIGLFTFAEAQVSIKLKQQVASISETFTASKDIEDEEAVPFEVLKITEKLEERVEATGEEVVEKKASGEIVIFNKHSQNSQVLIKNTRFETPGGLIFRINGAVTVPGMQDKNGETVPGQIKVKVFADKPGEKYNVDLTDFTIPGFEGLPQFDNFFARSATKMTGGFSGKMSTVDPDSLTSTRKDLQQKLELSLREKISGEVPESLMLLPNSIEISFENNFEEDGKLVTIEETGSAYALVLDKVVLQKLITDRILQDQEDETRVENLENVTIETEIQGDLSSLSSFQFTLTDPVRLVWLIDEESIKMDLAGQPRKDLGSVMRKYPSVTEASVTIKPFWKRSFPKKESRINIETIINNS
jgi:hypothetical protein